MILNNEIGVYTIIGKSGLTVRVTNYGARIMGLLVPSKTGIMQDIVLGYDSPEQYFKSNELYYGAAIGRYGNRISNSKFFLDGKYYTLSRNHGENHLHGGIRGFHNIVWKVEDHNESMIRMVYTSPDMEDGYPGELETVLTYSISDNNELRINYRATTDSVTIFNPTHHSFFNLTGDFTNTINEHYLEINGDYITSIDNLLIPDGRLVHVEDTPFDFREMKKISENLKKEHEQLLYGKGFDHNWILNKDMNKSGPSLAARVMEKSTGRIMEVYTDEPGMQFYGGNFLNGSDTGKGQVQFHHRTAFCLEAQHYPDSPNRPEFPSVVLQPDSVFNTTTIYKFLVQQG
jgi:aldose 1-epimerase